MPDQTLDQLVDSASAQDTDNLYATRNGNSIRMKLAVALASRAPTNRIINTLGGIKGGGNLDSDRNLELDVNGLSEDLAPDLTNDFVLSHDTSTGQPRKVRMNRIGSSTGGGGETSGPSFSIIASAGQTNVSATTPGEILNFAAGANIQIQTDAAAKTVRWLTTGLASSSIAINAGAGMTGGGNLTTNRSLSVDIAGLSEDTAPDSGADYVMTHDSSSGLLRKVRLALLSSSSYSLPTASANRLGGVRIGNGFTYDELSGILSVAPTGTSYVLPAASATTRGGIRIGAGLTINGDLLTNANPTPYVLPPAGVNDLGGVKAGQNITIAPDGTISASGGGSSGATESAFKPETYGAIRGTGLTQQQRESNATAINTCWTQASTIKGRVDMGGGTWEIYGPITLSNVSNVRIDGDWCTIRQFQTNVSVMSITNASQITLTGFMLSYQSNQIVGLDPVGGDSYVAALRLNGITNCRFSDLDTRNAWVHIGLSGGTGSFSNTFTNTRLNLATGQSWGLVYRGGNGNNFVNLRVSGTASAQAVSGGVYVSAVDQLAFTNLICENLDATRPLSFTSVRAATVTGGVFSAIRPRAVAGYGVVVHGSTGTMIQLTGIHVGGTVLDGTTQAMSEVSIFGGEEGCAFLVANLSVSGTTKDGAPRFSLLGHTSAAAARNLSGTFQQVRLDTNPASPHRIDDLAVASVDPTSDSLMGPLLSYNSVLGEVTGSLYVAGDESLTVYPAVHGRHIQVNSPLTAERTITLSRQIDRPYASGSYSAPRTVRGATMRITRTAASSGIALLTVANHNGTSIVALSNNQSVLIVFDGTNFVMVPGSLSGSSGGSGGTTVVYATTVEATTGTSTNTVMNPARTKEAFNAFAAENELTGTQGQVLGFDTAGNAVAVKLTRTVLVPLVAESVVVTVGVSVRRIAMPISMKLIAVRVFIPFAGTTTTTVDVNVSGVSILTAPLSVAGNSSTASTSAFTSASGGTISQGAVLDFDIDAAGTGAKGVQVTLVGHEV
jgi:hypothetical protein